MALGFVLTMTWTGGQPDRLAGRAGQLGIYNAMMPLAVVPLATAILVFLLPTNRPQPTVAPRERDAGQGVMGHYLVIPIAAIFE